MASGERLQQPTDADLVDHLRQLAGSRWTEEGDGAAARPQNGLGANEWVRLATAHDRERPVLGTRLTAGHRRIDEMTALFAASLGQLARDAGRGRGVVDDDPRRLEPSQDAVAPQDHRP